MLGVGINVATVLLGGALGLLLGGRVAQRLRDTVMQGLGLCVLVIGALSALENRGCAGADCQLRAGRLSGRMDKH